MLPLFVDDLDFSLRDNSRKFELLRVPFPVITPKDAVTGMGHHHPRWGMKQLFFCFECYAKGRAFTTTSGVKPSTFSSRTGRLPCLYPPTWHLVKTLNQYAARRLENGMFSLAAILTTRDSIAGITAAGLSGVHHTLDKEVVRIPLRPSPVMLRLASDCRLCLP